MKKFFERWWPFFVFLLLYIGIFYKVFFHHLFPIPADLLVSFFFPYNSGGWEGYSSWITRKEFIAADVVRQLYPWRELAMEYFKAGTLPLWNPYQFAGSPLLGNMQSAVFYPLNILFFFLDPKIAWSTYILLEPVLGFLFMYWFIRSLGLSRMAATFCGLTFPFMSAMAVQFAWGNVVHAYVWLPLVLYGISAWGKKKEQKFLLISTLGIACSLLAGYIQPTVYLLIISCVYFCFTMWQWYKKEGTTAFWLIKNVWFFPLGFGLAAIQLFPLYKAYSLSARDSNADTLFHQFQFAYAHVVTLFAPDFFGNPGTLNFWGKNYGEFMLSVGVVTLFFALVGLWYKRNVPLVRWFGVMGFLAVLFAAPTPLSELLLQLKIMVLSTGVPARALFITQFALVVIAGYGIDYLFSERKSTRGASLFLFLCYGLLWLLVLLTPTLWKESLLSEHIAVARRNLVMPTMIASIVIGVSLLRSTLWQYRVVLFGILLCVAAFEYQYFMYKFTSFSPLSYLYPQHTLVTYLQKTVGNDRIYGYDGAGIGTNLPTAWRLQYPEGFDSIILRRYGELVYATHKGKLVREIPRSDANFATSLPIDDSYPKQVVMNILGVTYVLDKNDAPHSEFEPRPNRFPPDRYDLVWQQNVFQVYTNKKALPRAAVFYNAQRAEGDSQIIQTLFDPKFDYRKTLILEDLPKDMQFTADLPLTPATITSYKANRVDISVDAKQNGILFLSDTLYPGWAAFVDGKQVHVYRANYDFRAVVVPKGVHQVSFVYYPQMLKRGMAITGMCVVIFVGLTLSFAIRRKPLHKKR